MVRISVARDRTREAEHRKHHENSQKSRTCHHYAIPQSSSVSSNIGRCIWFACSYFPCLCTVPCSKAVFVIGLNQSNLVRLCRDFVVGELRHSPNQGMLQLVDDVLVVHQCHRRNCVCDMLHFEGIMFVYDVASNFEPQAHLRTSSRSDSTFHPI